MNVNVRFQDYFLLKRESFSINPFDDAGVYFGSAKLHERIIARIEGDFAQARGVPKFFIHGAYGSGKTHTLANISQVLNSNNLEPVKPLYLNIAPLKHKERFSTVQGRFLDAIGLDPIQEAVEKFVTSTSGDRAEAIKERLKYGDTSLKSSQANIFRNILFGGPQRTLSWEWLKGAQLTNNDRQMLQVTKVLGQPGDYVDVLLNTALLYQHGLGMKIAFLVDEAEAFRDVTDPDSLAELTFAIRQICDDNNNVMGFIAAIQPEGGQGELGGFFTDPGIERRIGFQAGYFDLTALVAQPMDAQRFIDELLAYLIDQKRAADLCVAEELNCSPSHFPFDDSALGVLIEHIKADTRQQTPAGIIQHLASAAIEAWRRRSSKDKHVTVDGSIMERTLYPENA